MSTKRKTKKMSEVSSVKDLKQFVKDADLINNKQVKNLFKDYKPNTSNDQYKELLTEVDNVTSEFSTRIREVKDKTTELTKELAALTNTVNTQNKVLAILVGTIVSILVVGALWLIS